MLEIEQQMLEATLPSEQAEILLRLFGVPFNELPEGWFESHSTEYRLPGKLISERARKAAEGRLKMPVLNREFIERLAERAKDSDYIVHVNKNRWSKEVIQNYPTAIDSENTFGKTEPRKVRLNIDDGRERGRESFLNSLLEYWFVGRDVVVK